MSLFRFIAAEKTNYPISLMCRMVGVSRSGFHAWELRPPSDRALNDAWLTERIRAMYGAAATATAPAGSTSISATKGSASAASGSSG